MVRVQTVGGASPIAAEPTQHREECLSERESTSLGQGAFDQQLMYLVSFKKKLDLGYGSKV